MTTSALTRFQDLWHRKTTQAPLTFSELEELAKLEAEVLAEEAALLVPSNARLRAEVDLKAQTVATLELLLLRAEALVATPNPTSESWIRERSEVLQAYHRLRNGKDNELAA